jgi:hypothetical protein
MFTNLLQTTGATGPLPGRGTAPVIATVPGSDVRIVRNVGMYGACRSIVAYRGSDEIGRASMSHRDGGMVWDIGPAGRDDFDVEMPVAPTLANAEILDNAEFLLRLTISAAAASDRRAA